MSAKEKYRILIVDDSMVNIMALAEILKNDYEIIIATDGNKAIARAEKHIPDLILLDIIMPEIDGFGVLGQLKTSDLTKDIPVIFITGLDSSDHEEKGLALGAVDYITKPFKDSIVKLRVNTQLKILGYVRTIEQLSLLDTLTELPNRRSFNNKINAEWGRAVRDKTPVSILMLDIDKFKNYNDTYGHQQGDALLQSVSRVFKRTLKRKVDFVARWGGEEFIILLPNTDMAGALTVAEEIRKNIEQTVTSCTDGTETTVTVSIGVNSKTPSLGDTIDEFITVADKALYTAKNSGRNRVCSN